MSSKQPLPFHLKTSLFASGERRAFLVDNDRQPEPYSTLYVTMRVRNAGLSVATQLAALTSINVLFAHAAQSGINLFERFKAGDFLDRYECEALRRSVETSHGPETKRQAVVVAIGKGKRGYVPSTRTVARATQFMRYTHIARYLNWLGGELSGESGDTRASAIDAMTANILALRPNLPKGSGDIDKNKFSKDDDALLVSVITPSSERNPFLPAVQVRNMLLVDLLRITGKRRGEVLNIRVSDIDLPKRQINIVRRANDKHDPRVNQPLVKTRSHTVPIGQSVVDLIGRYLAVRRTVPGAAKQPYLLVTHKSGPTQGQAMTIEALKEVFRTIKKAEPRLSHLHPHLLRHFSSDQIARKQHEEPASANNRESHRRERNYLAGRAPDSDVDALYTMRETDRQARAVSLRVQEDLAKSVKNRDGA